MNLRGLGALVFLAEVVLAALFSAMVGIGSGLSNAVGGHLHEYHGHVSPRGDTWAERDAELTFMLTFDITLCMLLLASAIVAGVWRASRAKDYEQSFEKRTAAPFFLDHGFATALAQAVVLSALALLIHRSPIGFETWSLLMLGVSSSFGLGVCFVSAPLSRPLALTAALVVLLVETVSGITAPALFLRPSLALQTFAFVLLLLRPELALRSARGEPATIA